MAGGGGGAKISKNIFFLKISKMVIMAKNINEEKKCFLKGVWPRGCGRGGAGRGVNNNFKK